jgi:hypothetical protein
MKSPVFTQSDTRKLCFACRGSSAAWVSRNDGLGSRRNVTAGKPSFPGLGAPRPEVGTEQSHNRITGRLATICPVHRKALIPWAM